MTASGFEIILSDLSGVQTAGAVIIGIGVLCAVVILSGRLAAGLRKKRAADTDTPRPPQVAVDSIAGTRKYQQDKAVFGIAVHKDRTERFAVVCDGMGGMQQGERASGYCCERLAQRIKEERDWDQTPEFLCGAIEEISGEIYRFSDDTGERADCGTTVVAAVVCDNRLFWASAGDSRIYLFRGGRLNCLTRDHNYALQLKEGLLAEDFSNSTETKGMEEALISYVGMEEIAIIDVNADEMSLNKGDILLLCSDGVTKLLPDEDIEATIKRNIERRPREIAGSIVEASAKRRKKFQDNTTAVVLKIN